MYNYIPKMAILLITFNFTHFDFTVYHQFNSVDKVEHSLVLYIQKEE